MKTFTAKNETVKRDWYVVDAAGQTLGRLATEIASRLRGKHKPEGTLRTLILATISSSSMQRKFASLVTKPSDKIVSLTHWFPRRHQGNQLRRN